MSNFQYTDAHLEIRHLALLHALARWGSATAAAENLGISPSAISHRLREAERRLGIHLTVRAGSRLRLTEAGERLVRSADRILDELDRSEIDAVRIGQGIGPVVRIGIGTYSFFNWLPKFMQELESVFPEIKLEIVGSATYQPLAHLRDEKVDILLMPGQVTERGVVALPSFSDELVCVMAPEHKLAGLSFVEAADLQDETHVTYSSEILTGFEYESFFRPGGHYPRKLMNMALPEAVMELVSTGFGVSILSRWALGPRLLRHEVVSARLTHAGLPLIWHTALREKDHIGGLVKKVAEILANWLIEERSQAGGLAQSI